MLILALFYLLNQFEIVNGFQIGKFYSSINVGNRRNSGTKFHSAVGNAGGGGASTDTSAPPPTEVWWKSGLSFKCTGCGRCCQNEGEVWLDIDEFDELSAALNMTHAAMIEEYVESIKSNWVKLKSRGDDIAINGSVAGQCIFLGEDGKQCTIYEQRPAQCRTYPYWPRLLDSPGEFSSEGVLPSGEGGPDARHWSAESGGCEGIEHKDAVLVPSQTIHRNLELYNSYTSAFPFLTNGDDRNRLIASSEVIRAVIRSTKAWVDNFVVKYDLCPFARSVFESDRVRYRVFLGSDPIRLKDRVRYEMLHLLTVPEEQVATTLLIAPFAFSRFSDFNTFITEYEDNELSAILREMRGPGAIGPARVTKGRLGSRVVSRDAEEKREIQLASFHPNFHWADSDFEDPLNFEKRSPFPVINLLRAARVKEYANADSTKRIAGYNVKSLREAGADALREEMEALIRIALS